MDDFRYFTTMACKFNQVSLNSYQLRDFNSKNHFFGVFKSKNRYHHLRWKLQHVEYHELEEFRSLKNNPVVMRLRLQKYCLLW